eukprot:c44085_g1_i1 orf=41-238(+)
MPMDVGFLIVLYVDMSHFCHTRVKVIFMLTNLHLRASSHWIQGGEWLCKRKGRHFETSVTWHHTR